MDANDLKKCHLIQASSILKATQIIEHLDHTEFTFSYLGKLYRSKTHLLGAYNVNNILAAISVAIEIGIEMEKILASVESFPGVEGRLEEFTINNKKVFVDFAHTTDGL